MKRIFVPTQNVEDWKRGLAEPDKQWKAGYSAHALASSWEIAQGIPKEVLACLAGSGMAKFQHLELLAAFPEYQVALPPPGAPPSQSDIFALALDADHELLAMMVEGKKDETFGPTVGEWQTTPSPGKQTRLAFLREQLGLDGDLDPAIRYQLVHRTASAIIEAKRFKAKTAVMLVQSFNPEQRWFEDYAAFVRVFGKTAPAESVMFLKNLNGLELYSGWVTTA